VTGLVGFDTEHGGKAEVHPVWAMAIRVKDDPSDEVWAIFVRNWGNEGYCSQDQHYLDLLSNTFTFKLPWRSDESSVSIVEDQNATQFYTNDIQASGPHVSYAVNEGVLVTFTLSPPREHGTLIDGELHLYWSKVFAPPAQNKPVVPAIEQGFKSNTKVFVPPAQNKSAVPAIEQEDDPESHLSKLMDQMTPQQYQTFLAKLPKKNITKDGIVMPPAKAAVAVPHLSMLLPGQSYKTPSVRAEFSKYKAEKDQQIGGAWIAAFGSKKALLEAFNSTMNISQPLKGETSVTPNPSSVIIGNTTESKATAGFEAVLGGTALLIVYSFMRKR
jgi:hypothetical protein